MLKFKLLELPSSNLLLFFGNKSYLLNRHNWHRSWFKFVTLRLRQRRSTSMPVFLVALFVLSSSRNIGAKQLTKLQFIQKYVTDELNKLQFEHSQFLFMFGVDWYFFSKFDFFSRQFSLCRNMKRICLIFRWFKCLWFNARLSLQ